MTPVRKMIKAWLLRHDMIISRPPGQFDVQFHKLEKARERGLRVRVAVDGGAATGNWTRSFKELYPDAQVLCVEPRDDAQPALRELGGSSAGIHIAQVLLGARDGTTPFYEHREQSSILKPLDQLPGMQCRELPLMTLDRLIKERELPDPDLIKLDLQGAELICLEGADRCLRNAQAVILEVSFIPFMEGMPLVADVIAFMNARGFRCYDVLAMWHRPLDGALAQGDLLFVREGIPLLADSRWGDKQPG